MLQILQLKFPPHSFQNPFLSLHEGLAPTSLWLVLTRVKKVGWLMLTTAILAWGLQGSAWGPRMVLHGIARRCKAAHGAQRQITDNLHRSNPLTQATPPSIYLHTVEKSQTNATSVIIKPNNPYKLPIKIPTWFNQVGCHNP